MTENNNKINTTNEPKEKQRKIQFNPNFLAKSIGTFSILLIVFFFFLPLLDGTLKGTGTHLSNFTLIFLFAAMALTLNLEVGYLGIPNFGKVAFIMVGAYSYTFFFDYWHSDFAGGGEGQLVAISLLMSIIVTGFFGLLLTLPTLKLREDYLAIVTIVAGEIVRQIAVNEDGAGIIDLGGPDGFRSYNPADAKFSPQEHIGGFYLTNLTLVVVVILVGLTHAAYQFSYRKNHQIDEFTRLQGSIQRAITVAGVLSIVILALDYFGSITVLIFPFPGLDRVGPSFSLHMFIILLLASLVIYKSFLSKKVKPIFLFIFNYVLISFNYILAQVIDIDKGLHIKYMIIKSEALTEIKWVGYDFKDNTGFKLIQWYTMMFALIGLIFIYIIIEEIYYTPFGRTLRAIREDDTSAISVGKGIFHYRLRALIIASSLAGLAGALFAIHSRIFTPFTFLPLMTFQLYIMLIIGGTGNNKGAIFGAIIIMMLDRTLRSTIVVDRDFGNYWLLNRPINPENLGLIIMGVLFIMFLIYAPDGVIPEKRNHNARYYRLAAEAEGESFDRDFLSKLVLNISNTNLEVEEFTGE